MAAIKVFNIPELLELVLQELPFKDALRMIRVNRTFRDTVRLSPALRRKLFLQQHEAGPAKQTVEPEINPVLSDMFSYFTRKHVQHRFALISLEVVQPSSEVYHSYSDREKRVNDMARKQGSPYFVWFDVGKYKTSRMEELIKWMRSCKSLWQDMYVTDRHCAIIGGWSQFDGDYLFPPNMKMEQLLRRLIKRNRYRFRFHGPGTKWRNSQILDEARIRIFGRYRSGSGMMVDHRRGTQGVPLTRSA